MVAICLVSRCHFQCVGQRDMEAGGGPPKWLRGDDLMDTRWARKHRAGRTLQTTLSKRVVVFVPVSSWNQFLALLNIRQLKWLFYFFEGTISCRFVFLSCMNTWLTCTEVWGQWVRQSVEVENEEDVVFPPPLNGSSVVGSLSKLLDLKYFEICHWGFIKKKTQNRRTFKKTKQNCTLLY